MSHEDEETIESAGATIVPLVRYEITVEEIRKLVAGYDAITSAETPNEYAEARKARAHLRTTRTSVEQRRKDLKKGALAYGKAVDSVAKELTAAIEPTEDRIDALIRAVDEEKERVKREAAEAEQRAIEETIRKAREEEETRIRLQREAVEARAKAEREAEEKRLADERAELEVERAKLEEARRQHEELAKLQRAEEAAKIDAERAALHDNCVSERIGGRVISLRIVLDGDGAFPEYEGKLRHADLAAVSALPGGTASGAPSVGLFIPLEDGTVVYAETTLKLFLTAADAFKSKYGDPRGTPTPAEREAADRAVDDALERLGLPMRAAALGQAGVPTAPGMTAEREAEIREHAAFWASKSRASYIGDVLAALDASRAEFEVMRADRDAIAADAMREIAELRAELNGAPKKEPKDWLSR